MKKTLLGILVLSSILFSDVKPSEQLFKIPERVDGYGNVQKEKIVTSKEALKIIEIEKSKKKQPRNKCIINGEILYFDLSSQIKKENKFTNNHTYLGYGKYYLINGIRQESSPKVYFWRDNTIPKEQSWKINTNLVK